MSSLPTYPPTEVATKSDVVRLEGRFDRLGERFDRLEDRFDERFDGLARTLVTATVTAMIALTAVFG